MDLRCQRCQTVQVGHKYLDSGFVIEIYCYTCGYTYIFHDGKGSLENGAMKMERMRRTSTCLDCRATIVDYRSKDDRTIRVCCDRCLIKKDNEARRRSEERKNASLSEDEKAEEA